MKTLKLIGNTPILQIPGENIYIKMEKFNPGGSIKDRTALGMIRDAEKRGALNTNSTIVEPTSGNTGIGLAYIGRLLGYKVVIVMPETMSQERRVLIASYGAKLILTEGTKGMAGAIAKAKELVQENKDYFMPDQFNNPANVDIHYTTTGAEIAEQMKTIDVFVAAYGTGGSFTGIAKRLKEYNSQILTIIAEPMNTKHHKIQGIGPGFVPSILGVELADEIIAISDEEALTTTIEVSKKLGVLIGISTGGNVAGARKVAEKYGKDKMIVTLSPDGGEKYLSVVDYADGNK